MTRFLALANVIVAQLQAAPAVSAQVDRTRLRPVAAQHDTAVVVRLQGADPQRAAIVGGRTDWATTVHVECYARAIPAVPGGAAAIEADDALDALQAAVWARLMANPTLSGTVADLEPTGIEWDYAAEAAGMGCATLTFIVKHSTPPDSLE